MKLKIVPVCLFVVAAGCAKKSEITKENYNRSLPPSGNGTGQAPTIPNSKPKADTSNLVGEVVLREFSPSDTGALFLIHSEIGEKIVLKQFRGPSFLKELTHGTLDAASASGLFVNGTHPMPAGSRQMILQKYSGAQFVYFFGYNGNFCAGEDSLRMLSIDGLVNDAPFTLTFEIRAIPHPIGNCDLRVAGTVITN